MCLPVQNLLVSVPMYCMVTGYNYLSSFHSQLNSENGQIPLAKECWHILWLFALSFLYSSLNMLYYLWIGDFQRKTNLHEKQGVPSLDVVVAQGQLLPMPVLIQWASLGTGTGSHPVSGGLLPQPGPSVQQEGTTTDWVKGLRETLVYTFTCKA